MVRSYLPRSCYNAYSNLQLRSIAILFERRAKSINVRAASQDILRAEIDICRNFDMFTLRLPKKCNLDIYTDSEMSSKFLRKVCFAESGASLGGLPHQDLQRSGFGRLS